jgi:hypothetical protein
MGNTDHVTWGKHKKGGEEKGEKCERKERQGEIELVRVK